MPSHYNKEESTEAKGKEEQLAPAVLFVKDEWERWDSHWSGRFGEFEQYYDRWNGKQPTRQEEWQAQFTKRLTWQAEKTLVARYSSALFPSAAPIQPMATEVEDELQGIKAKSIVAHWFKIGKFKKEHRKALRSSAIYGTGLFEDDWFQRVDRIPKKIDAEIDDMRALVGPDSKQLLNEKGEIRTEKVGSKKVIKTEWTNEVVEDRYRVLKSNIFAWRVHPNKLEDDDDFGCIKQEYVTYEKLLKIQQEGESLGFEAFPKEAMSELQKSVFKPNEEQMRRLQKEGDYKDEHGRIELLHYWGYYGEGDGEKKKMWMIVANRKWELRNIDNPRWDQNSPLFHIKWHEDEKPSYYGIGTAQTGADAEDRANKNVNTRIDILSKIARMQGWYNALDKKIKKNQLTKNVPGLMRACSDIRNAFAYDQVPGLRPEDYKEEETAVNDHREITGATTSLLPTADVGQQHNTLGGMEILTSSALQRLKPDLEAIEEAGIRQMANRGFLMTMQNFSKPEAIELVASKDQRDRLHLEKIYKLQPGEIRKKVNFYCTGVNESVEKDQNMQRLVQYLQVVSKLEPMQKVINFQNIARRIALWLGFEDVEDFIQMNPLAPLQEALGIQPPGQGAPRPGQPGAQPGGQGGGLPPEMIQKIAQSVGGQGQRR